MILFCIILNGVSDIVPMIDSMQHAASIETSMQAKHRSSCWALYPLVVNFPSYSLDRPLSIKDILQTGTVYWRASYGKFWTLSKPWHLFTYCDINKTYTDKQWFGRQILKLQSNSEQHDWSVALSNTVLGNASLLSGLKPSVRLEHTSGFMFALTVMIPKAEPLVIDYITLQSGQSFTVSCFNSFTIKPMLGFDIYSKQPNTSYKSRIRLELEFI